MAKKNITEQNNPSDFFSNKKIRLQEIVDILNDNEKPLEELIALYEEGMGIAKECKTYLNTMEGKIIDITKEFQEEDD